MQWPADSAKTHAQHWGPSLTLTVFRCAGWGCFTTLPETPVLQQVLQRAPSCPAAQAPSGTSAFSPPSCFTRSGGPHSGLHGGPFIKTLLAHWRYTNWGSWKTFICKGGTVSPRRMGMCALHCPVLCRGFAPFPSLPGCPGFPAKGNLPKVSPSGPLPQRTLSGGPTRTKDLYNCPVPKGVSRPELPMPESCSSTFAFDFCYLLLGSFCYLESFW